MRSTAFQTCSSIFFEAEGARAGNLLINASEKVVNGGPYIKTQESTSVDAIATPGGAFTFCTG